MPKYQHFLKKSTQLQNIKQILYKKFKLQNVKQKLCKKFQLYFSFRKVKS